MVELRSTKIGITIGENFCTTGAQILALVLVKK
jgi:hypothetical protein